MIPQKERDRPCCALSLLLLYRIVLKSGNFNDSYEFKHGKDGGWWPQKMPVSSWFCFVNFNNSPFSPSIHHQPSNQPSFPSDDDDNDYEWVCKMAGMFGSMRRPFFLQQIIDFYFAFFVPDFGFYFLNYQVFHDSISQVHILISFLHGFVVRFCILF